MIYMGSKNRIAKYILPIILKNRTEGQWYVEPFVGGANLIDKVKGNRLGYDINPYVIEALNLIKNNPEGLPESLSEKEYKELKDKKELNGITGFVGFSMSFGARFFQGYARGINGNYALVAKKNAIKQSPNLKGINFIVSSYDNIIFPERSIIYCDPPYKNSKKYSTGIFDYEKFYDWCRDMKKIGHTIFVSEYSMPEDFIQVWQGEIKTNFASTRTKATHSAIEKLFTL